MNGSLITVSSSFRATFSRAWTPPMALFAQWKKLRAFLRLKCTLLKHEETFFKRLDGHRAIPMVYGYAHIEHFKYLAIDLLGKSLADDNNKFVRKISIQEIANIGICCFYDYCCCFSLASIIKLSVLEHTMIMMTSSCIATRTPSLKTYTRRCRLSHLYFIDFGLARRRIYGTPREVDLVKERINVFGTLSWGGQQRSAQLLDSFPGKPIPLGW